MRMALSNMHTKATRITTKVSSQPFFVRRFEIAHSTRCEKKKIQLLRQQCTKQPSEEIEYLDLSLRGIGKLRTGRALNFHTVYFLPVPVWHETTATIECLDVCTRLRFLVLRNNAIDAIRNVEMCRHLWRIDLTGNRVKLTRTFTKFSFATWLFYSWASFPRTTHR